MNWEIIPSLTSMRFFAATIVVLFHYDKNDQLFPTWVCNFGYEAVTFFFILSGFILTHVHVNVDGQRNLLNVSYKKFIALRLARLLPAYTLALALSFPFLLYSSFVSHTMNLERFLTILFLVPLFLQAWHPPTALAWNVPAWSLSVELFFYALFPAIVRSAKRIHPYLFVVFALFLVCINEYIRNMLAAIWDHPLNLTPRGSFLYYSPLMQLPKFIFGVALGAFFIWSGRVYSKLSEVWLVFAFASVITAMYLKSEITFLASDMALCLVFGFLILSCAGTSGLISKILSYYPLVILGEASYSLYIMHWPIYKWWSWVTVQALGVNIRPEIDFTLYFSMVVISSVLTLYLVERPAKGLILSRLLRRSINRPMQLTFQSRATDWVRIAMAWARR